MKEQKPNGKTYLPLPDIYTPIDKTSGLYVNKCESLTSPYPVLSYLTLMSRRVSELVGRFSKPPSTTITQTGLLLLEQEFLKHFDGAARAESYCNPRLPFGSGTPRQTDLPTKGSAADISEGSK